MCEEKRRKCPSTVFFFLSFSFSEGVAAVVAVAAAYIGHKRNFNHCNEALG